MSKSMQHFHVAISYASEDTWLAKDIATLLQEYQYEVYCSGDKTDAAAGILNLQLDEIFRDSSLNVLISSKSYLTKISVPIEVEKKRMADRHFTKHDVKSLFVITADGCVPPAPFDGLLRHNVLEVGVLSLADSITKRLEELPIRHTNSGMVTHPKATLFFRGKLTPCAFTIRPDFRSGGERRWEKLGDVLVNFPNDICKKVFLIPSGGTHPEVRHTRRWVDEEKYLRAKKAATEAFVTEVGTRVLDGFSFTENKTDREIVAIYSADYDKYLNENFSKYLRSNPV